MALLLECIQKCAQKLLDTADIVRDGDFSPFENQDCSPYRTQGFIHACKQSWICGHENQVIILGQVRFGLYPAELLPKHASKVGVFGVMKTEIEVDESMHLPCRISDSNMFLWGSASTPKFVGLPKTYSSEK